MTANQITLWYLVASVCFILALKGLSSPATARRGNWIGAVGMAIAIVATLFKSGVHITWEMPVAALIGSAFGLVGARRVKMTAMPQMVALFNGVGGGAAALVSLAERLSAERRTEIDVQTFALGRYLDLLVVPWPANQSSFCQSCEQRSPSRSQ